MAGPLARAVWEGAVVSLATRKGFESPTGAATPGEALGSPTRSLSWGASGGGEGFCRDMWSGQGAAGGLWLQWQGHLSLRHHTLLEQAVQQLLSRAPGAPVKESSGVWNQPAPHTGGESYLGMGVGDHAGEGGRDRDPEEKG